MFRDYAEDEQNTETATTMALLVGGGSAATGGGSGIHWHMNLDNEIEYVATDSKREVIPYVRLRTRDGQVREYTAPDATAAQIAAGQRRRMDCMDCHNRPAHTFSATPQRAVDAAIARGGIPRELPFVRREAVAAVSAEYPDKEAALAGDRDSPARALPGGAFRRGAAGRPARSAARRTSGRATYSPR